MNSPTPVWRRISGRLVRMDLVPVSDPPSIMDLANQPQPQTLKDLCYPVGSVQSSCIRLSQLNANNFKIKSQIINMLPRFTGMEDAYIFIRKFEEVCATMKL